MNRKITHSLLLFVWILLLNATSGFAQCQWMKISAGKKHNLAIKNDGTLWAWGVNNKAQLGDGTLTSRNVPTQIGADTTWVAVSAGESHSVAIKEDGTLWAWGDNSKGQSGDGSGLILRMEPTQIGTDSFWSQIDAGYDHTLAISAEGLNTKLWTWGSNISGQLGLGVSDAFIPEVTQVGTGLSWAAISAGGQHSLAMEFVTGGKKIWAFGDNSKGQLGTMNFVSSNVPVAVVASFLSWSRISAGGEFSVARKSDGTLWTWGNAGGGQLGNGQTSDYNTATQMNADTDWSTGFSAGDEHVLAKKANGSIWAWGRNNDGQLGDGTTNSSSSPVQIGTDVNWSGNLVAGFAHSGGIRLDGTLNTWGFGGNGELGNGFNLTVQNPTLIDCPVSSYLNLNEVPKVNKVEVYPNPTSSGNFQIQMETIISEIKIYDVLGRPIDFLWNQQQTIYLNEKAGTYFLVVIDQNNQVFREKIVLN